jgi:hypothetical protein
VSVNVKAPDWSKNYPSGGRQIGPAWQREWDALADGQWHDSAVLADLGARAGACADQTARRMLFYAAAHGLLLKQERLDETTKRWRSWYRRADLAEVSA